LKFLFLSNILFPKQKHNFVLLKLFSFFNVSFHHTTPQSKNPTHISCEYKNIFSTNSYTHIIIIQLYEITQQLIIFCNQYSVNIGSKCCSFNFKHVYRMDWDMFDIERKIIFLQKSLFLYNHNSQTRKSEKSLFRNNQNSQRKKSVITFSRSYQNSQPEKGEGSSFF
jgi:hypothetical protein